MKDHRGLVVDIIDNNLVLVLKPCGDIEKVQTNGRTYEIGEEILFYEIVKTEKVVDWPKIVRYVSGVAVALLVFFASSLAFGKNGIMDSRDAYAASVSLYIESKPDIKVDINKDREVVDVHPLNKPGKRVLAKMGRGDRDADVSEFVEDYFEAAKETGYLEPQDKAIISVVPKIEEENNDTLKEIEEAVNDSLVVKENGLQVLTVAIPEVVVAKAEKLGLTPGKFAILLTAAVSGERVPPIQELKAATVTEIIKKLPTVRVELPKYTKQQLKQLVKIELPKMGTNNSQPISTKPAGTDSATSDTTKQIATEPSDGTQPSSETVQPSSETAQPSEEAAVSDSTNSTSESADSTATSSTDEMTAQPESQPQEGQEQEIKSDKSEETTEQSVTDQQPADEKPSGEQPADEKPTEEQPPDFKDKKPAEEQPGDTAKQQDPEKQQGEPANQPESEEKPEPDKKLESEKDTSAITAVIDWIKNVLS
jgi:hypothetical protein